MEHSRCGDNKREGLVIRWMAWAIAALLKPEALLVAENPGCLRSPIGSRTRNGEAYTVALL
jgi:hypothetical protein